MEQLRGDVIIEENGKFGFYDETGLEFYGPYDTRAEAENQLRRYGHWLNTGEVIP